MATISELKQIKEKRTNDLLAECSVFFAFSTEQFHENKTQLQEGEKYVRIGAGGYMPKSKVQVFDEGIKIINKWYKDEVSLSKLNESDILYELNNYECFYTGDVSDAYNELKDRYTLKQVKLVYNKYVNEMSEQY
jgi:hypothetical protein